MRLVVAFLVLLAQPALAFEYLLEFDRECDYQEGAFPCKKSAERAVIQQRSDGKWVGVNLDGSKIDLRVLKNDDYILAFDNPVYFHGTSIIYLMKKTGRFFWSEFAYSDILKSDEGHVRIGNIILKREK